MRIDRQPQDAQTRVEIMLPDRLVPIRRSALQLLSAPDIVDEYVDVAVLVANLIGQGEHLLGVKMVDGQGDANAAELV